MPITLCNGSEIKKCMTSVTYLLSQMRVTKFNKLHLTPHLEQSLTSELHDPQKVKVRNFNSRDTRELNIGNLSKYRTTVYTLLGQVGTLLTHTVDDTRLAHSWQTHSGLKVDTQLANTLWTNG